MSSVSDGDTGRSDGSSERREGHVQLGLKLIWMLVMSADQDLVLECDGEG